MILKKPLLCALCTFLLTLSVGCNKYNNTSGGIPPSQALDAFEIADGFQIELVASEPLIADPVAMEIDEYGRMYVVQMHGYPLDISGSGKIKLLSDEDGDGKMDKSITFAEGLTLPTGILRWKKGVLVTDPPNVLYLEDTNADGKADIQDTLLTGFALSNPQHNVNNPILGLDNWIYIGNEQAITTQLYQEEFGDRGGDIHYVNRPNGTRLPENARGRSVRMRPDRMGLETISSTTQFGHTFDVYGRHFLVSNAEHIYHEVIAAPYLIRNQDLLVSSAVEYISNHGNAADVFPITKNPEHQLLTDVGVFTSACGLTFYSGGLFPSPFDSIAFVAEPVSNIIHADFIRDKGTSFTAGRLYSEREFLASTDSWFRPVNMYVGPDGALYVVDYYRQIIEHPEWMAEEVVKSGALYNGKDQGRIYRISPIGTKPATWSQGLKLGDATNKELVDVLADSNIWWRRNAQRLLVDRMAVDVVPDLVNLTKDLEAPLGRLHALWTLEGLGELKEEQLVSALQDPIPGIRENAIRLTEHNLLNSTSLISALQALQNDPDSKVRFQLLSTLGFVDTPQAAAIRKNILFRDLEDPWMQIAALSAYSLDVSDLLESLIDRYEAHNPAFASLIERLSAMAGASGQVATIKNLIKRAVEILPENTEWQASILNGLSSRIKSESDQSWSLHSEQKALLKQAFSHPSPAIRKACLKMLAATGLPVGDETEAALRKAEQICENTSASLDERIDAIKLLSLDNPKKYELLLKRILVPTQPYTIQLEALHALNAIPDETVSRYVLEKWNSFTPDLRDAAINTFLENDTRVTLLLDAIDDGNIDQSIIGWRRSVSLMTLENETLKTRARGILTRRDESRESVIKQYQFALNLEGDKLKGAAVFQQQCSICHQVGGSDGIAFGPDLGTVRSRSATSIMDDILDPNLSIADGYDIWMIDLASGQSVRGLIASESPSAITLHNQGGNEKVIPRQEIVSLKPLGMSTMPVGLEKQITPEEMADLLAFIKNK